MSRVLKVSNNWAVLMAVGREFQALGPAELKMKAGIDYFEVGYINIVRLGGSHSLLENLD